jgi:uncharacterized membrane protein YkvI
MTTTETIVLIFSVIMIITVIELGALSIRDQKYQLPLIISTLICSGSAIILLLLHVFGIIY